MGPLTVPYLMNRCVTKNVTPTTVIKMHGHDKVLVTFTTTGLPPSCHTKSHSVPGPCSCLG